MNPAGPALRDIHLPTVAWWPLAPGWWVMLAAVALVLAAIIVGAVRHRRRRMLRAALRVLDRLRESQQSNPDAAELVAQASQLLRRVARQVEPAAASADGAAWREFVQRYARTAPTREVLQRLLDERYRRVPTLTATELVPALRDWCRAALSRGSVGGAQHARRVCAGEST